MKATCLSAALVLAAAIPASIGAQLKVNPLVHLGEIRGGPDLRVAIPLTNAGSRPLVILEVERGCACLTGAPDKAGLAPGESASLPLTLRTLGHKNGPYRWTAKVRYRLGEEVLEAPFRLEGTIRNEVTLEPSELALHLTGSLKQEVVLTDARPTPFKVQRLHSALPGLEFEVTQKAGVCRILIVADGARIPVGRQHGTLDIYTDDPQYAPLTLPIKIERAAKGIQATPERFRLNPSAGIRTALVRLRSENDKPLSILRVDAPAPLTATFAPSPTGGALVRVTLPPESHAAGAREVRIVLAESRSELVIPIDWE